MINNFKLLMVLFLLLCFISTGSADKSLLVTADPFPGERPGQYVYYHDMRTWVYGNKEPVNRLIGLMKADNKQYIIRILDIRSGKSFLYLGRFILNKGVMEFYTESIQGDSKEGTVFMADLMNLMNYIGAETIRYAPKIRNKNDITVNSDWTAYKRKLVNSYRWWIPFYQIESSANRESDLYGEKGYVSLRLICFGSVTQNDPDMFTRISKLPVYSKSRNDNKKYSIPAAEKINVKIDNTAFKLDRNWHFEKGDRMSGIPDTYILKKFTPRDAMIGVESIDLKNIKLEKNEIETFVNSLQFQTCVIHDTVSIDLKNKTLSLSLWDADSGSATFTKYVSLGIKKNLLSMLNFSALDFVYYGNMDYFDSLIKADFNN